MSTPAAQPVEVLDMEQVQAYLHVGRDKVVEFMNRSVADNPLPHVRSSEVNSKHSKAIFRRAWIDAWLDREAERQMGIAPFGVAIRRAG